MRCTQLLATRAVGLMKGTEVGQVGQVGLRFVLLDLCGAGFVCLDAHQWSALYRAPKQLWER